VGTLNFRAKHRVLQGNFNHLLRPSIFICKSGK
jgi:carbonic anhydrase/acetyltransferase-like protein (isoleucine patch superfamily)